MYQSSLYSKAMMCYYKFCKDNGIPYQEPSIHMSRIGSKYVHLENGNGPLPRFLIKDNEMKAEDVRFF